MKMKIRVKIMDQTDHPFEVDDQTLLSDFRLQVAERLNIPPERQRMIFAGHVLKTENSTLSACGLRDGHVVHLVERPADMPFPTSDVDSNAVHENDQPHHHHHHRPVRFLQNMFGQQTNERERVTYMIPFERSGLFEENSRIEELVRSTIDRIPYLTDDQRSRFNVHWDSNNTLHVALPAQRDVHIASPALERIVLIQTIFEQIAHFHNVTEAPGGMAERIDEFLEGSHRYDQENTTVMNDELRSIAVELDREVTNRSRLIDAVGSEVAGENETDEHEARYQRVEESEGSPGYVMRHAIAPDLVDILRRLQAEHEILRPHLLRFERILCSRILYNIDDAEHTDTDYRANFFTVYMEHLQRAIHRYSHAWHLASDLGVYLHTPLPRRLLPNYHQFRLLPPTEGQIILEFHAPQGGGPSQATTNEPTSRFLDMPPPGVDVAELTNQEVRIMGLNPTVRRMQQMGIAVPLPFPNVGHVQVPQGGPPSGATRMLAQRRVVPFQRNGSMQLAVRHSPGFAPTTSSDSQPEGNATHNQITHSRQFLNAGPTVISSGSEASSSNALSASSLENTILDALEHALPAAESGNPYERIMRTLLQLASDPSHDVTNILRSSSIQQAFTRGITSSELENASSGSAGSFQDNNGHHGQVSTLGNIARGVITQSGGAEMPFMSEVISNIMRNSGIPGNVQPQVDVFVEYGDAGQHPGMPSMPPAMLNMPVNGAPAEQGRQPTAIGYHVEVHQFDVFTNPPEQDSAHSSNQNALPPSTTSSTIASTGDIPSNVIARSSGRNRLLQGRQRPAGPHGGFPFMMGNMNFPTDLHVTAPRQEIVNVDPFLSCNSRFTDVQRVLRNNNPGVPTYISPFRRFMQSVDPALNNSNRRVAPVDGYERVLLELSTTGNVLMADESNFENFLQLTIRSALSQMAHADQDRNSQNARGISPQVFSMGQSVQIPGGGELVQVSAPVLIQAEIEQHPVLHQENAITSGSAENNQNGSTTSQNEQHYDYIPHDGEGRNLLTEMANGMTAGLDTRVSSILEASRAPASLLRPGNGSGLLAHLEGLLLNFATLGDLANVINANMSPLEQHRSRFRAHVIENQLNGNSMPSVEDLQSASERLAALPSSISSIITSAGGELVREWNARPLDITETIRNVEIATIQQLLRVLLDRHISDAEFSQRIQNCVRDYVRQLVALGNHCFASADETAYVRIVYELLMRGERIAGNPDANLSRLFHLRNSILPRIAVSIRDQGMFPNIDEIPSRLLAWASQNDGSAEDQSTKLYDRSTPTVSDAKENQDFSETRNRGATSNGPTPAKKRKVEEDAEPGPSTSCGFSHISATSQMPSSTSDPVTSVHLQDYDGDWRRSFPEWLEVIERDSLSAQTSPRQRRSRSDVYQTMLPEHLRRQVVHENSSETDVILSAMRESLRDVFRGNMPSLSDEHTNSPAVLSAMNDLLNSAVRHRLEDDPDYDPNRYPEIARKFNKKP